MNYYDAYSSTDCIQNIVKGRNYNLELFCNKYKGRVYSVNNVRLGEDITMQYLENYGVNFLDSDNNIVAYFINDSNLYLLKIELELAINDYESRYILFNIDVGEYKNA